MGRGLSAASSSAEIRAPIACYVRAMAALSDMGGRTEYFGPVLSVFAYRDLDQAIAIANDSRFGLAGAVISATS